MDRNQETHYYHAGAEVCGSVIWSGSTRHTYDSAASEAMELAVLHGGRAVVESWLLEHGEYPCDADAVESASYVEASNGS